jgi:hypothetical protein
VEVEEEEDAGEERSFFFSLLFFLACEVMSVFQRSKGARRAMI